MKAGSFALQLSDAVKTVSADIKREQNAIIFTLGSSIILDSPVDTGMFRANWRWSYSPTHQIVSAEDKSGAAAISDLTQFLQGFEGGEMWMLNGLPYAVALEFGHSQQAPRGFVRRNVARISQISSGGRK